MTHTQSRFAAALVTISFTVALAHSAEAQRRPKGPQELRGSKASVQKMYDFAQSHRLPFYLTPTNVGHAVAKGKLVALTGDSTYELTRGVGFSYSTREAKQFVLAFASQYLAACGVPLTVTSAARPSSRQPRNANARSVHPTGIAVDIRRPPAGPCQTWLRGALTELESKGVVEATEERHPVHVHVAVLVRPGAKVLLPNLVRTVVARQAPAVTTVAASSGSVAFPSGNAGGAKTLRAYTIRRGDTLWDIANRSGVSMSELARLNGRAAQSALRPGTTLLMPGYARS